LSFASGSRRRDAARHRGGLATPTKAKASLANKEEENGLLACEYSVLVSDDPEKAANLDPGHTKSQELKPGGGPRPVPHSFNVANSAEYSRPM